MKNDFKGKAGIERIINAISYSFSGFKVAFQKEEAFRQEILLTIILVPLAIYLANNAVETALLVLSTFLVPIIELVNSAIESTVDRISMKKHKLSMRAKDIGSAAVFLSLVNLFTVWLIIIFY